MNMQVLPNQATPSCRGHRSHHGFGEIDTPGLEPVAEDIAFMKVLGSEDDSVVF